MITINGENFSESDIEKIYKKISEIKIGETISKEELESFLHCLKVGKNDFKGITILKDMVFSMNVEMKKKTERKTSQINQSKQEKGMKQ